jgi:nucleoside-diphosphate-sugar epimerase
MKVVVTGASGFLGRYLIKVLRDSGHEVTAASRSRVEIPGIFYALAPELRPSANWRDTLQGGDAVVHLAGLAAVDGPGNSADLEVEYRKVNVEGTRALAKQAAKAGVKHFVLMSSLHSVAADSDERLSEQTEPRPVSVYGRSKLAAEKGLQEELRTSGCAWTILRPPLVYGRGNQANFDLLLKLVKTGIPLPLASVRNRRSFIYVENLVDLISKCLGNAKAFGKVYLPSDGEDVSTPELIRAIARANSGVEQGAGAAVASGEWRVAREKNRKTELNRQAASATSGNSPATSYPLPATPREARLFHFPPSLLRAAGRLPGLGALRKLTSSLYVDSEPLRRDLGWTPPFTMEEGLRRTLATTKNS